MICFGLSGWLFVYKSKNIFFKNYLYSLFLIYVAVKHHSAFVSLISLGISIYYFKYIHLLNDFFFSTSTSCLTGHYTNPNVEVFVHVFFFLPQFNGYCVAISAVCTFATWGQYNTITETHCLTTEFIRCYNICIFLFERIHLKNACECYIVFLHVLPHCLCSNNHCSLDVIQ